jgi:hypothetical protein
VVRCSEKSRSHLVRPKRALLASAIAAARLRSARFLRLFKLITSPIADSAVSNAAWERVIVKIEKHSAKFGYNL